MNRAYARVVLIASALILPALGHVTLLNKQALLDRESFWDNRDWD